MANKRSINDYLSLEMIFNILLLLPVTSLVRVKAVCKTWLSTIRRPEFVEAHLTNSKKKLASVLKACYDHTVYFMETREESVRLKLPSCCDGMVRYVRSCNGLVCLSDDYCDVICIWNPCTVKFKMLPSSKAKAKQTPLYLGFGFDSIGNDYKILRISMGGNKGLEPKGHLYSANDDSWKDIHVPVIEKSFWNRPRQIGSTHINGVLYVEGDDGVMSFDLHNEVFREIGVLWFPNHEPESAKPLFICIHHYPHGPFTLDFEGSVAMILQNDDDSFCSLWTLDDVCGTWSEKLNLEIDMELAWVNLYLGFEQFVVLNNESGYTFYDYREKATKELSFPAHPEDVDSVVKFTESLVSLQGFQLQE